MKLFFYLHTHWDREWYWNFNAYRLELTTVVKRALEVVRNGECRGFMLDGQTSLIDDVLEVSPSLQEEIVAANVAGKLFIGPWFVLADQLLVGGESLVRNLALGLSRAQELGGSARVGYCPDTFGHSLDLPRILRGFGIDNAVVWRGVPALNEPVFQWRSPDGSSVLALQMNAGYYHTAFFDGVSDEQMEAYLLAFLCRQRGKNGIEPVSFGPGLPGKKGSYIEALAGALVPVGGDHIMPPVNFSGQLQKLRPRLQELDVELQESDLGSFLALLRDAAAHEPVRLIENELRDNSAAFINERAYILDGVLSTRLYLKRANRLAEHRLLKQTEPLCAALAAFGLAAYPLEELNYSWKLLLLNHPHDSICGCSIDSVHREMMSRTDSLNAGLDTVERRCLEELGRRILGLPPLGEIKHGLGLPHLLDPELGKQRAFYFNSGASSCPQPVFLRRALMPGESPGMPLTQVTARYPLREAFAGLGGVPAFKEVEVEEGYLLASPKPFSLGSNYIAVAGRGADLSGESERLCLRNEYFEVFVQEPHMDSAPLVVRCLPGAGALAGRVFELGHHFIDRGDGGDTYNFDPLPGDKPLTARLVAVEPGEEGPLLASLRLTYEIDLPDGLEPMGELPLLEGEAENSPRAAFFKRSEKLVRHRLETTVSLKACLPIVFFHTEFENKVGEHRLEVVFNKSGSAAGAVSENHFSSIGRACPAPVLNTVAERDDLQPLGHEAPSSRYPCQRFFYSGEEVYFNSGLPEFGQAANQVSYTILRAVGNLSRVRLLGRGGGAGPCILTPEANCLGPQEVSYGWAPLALASLTEEPGFAGLDEPDAGARQLAEIYEGNLRGFWLPEGADRAALEFLDRSLFEISDRRISFQAFYQAGPDNCLVLRLLNSSGQELKLDIGLGFAVESAALCDLSLKPGRELSVLSGRKGQYLAAVRFGRYELLTIKMKLKGA